MFMTSASLRKFSAAALLSAGSLIINAQGVKVPAPSPFQSIRQAFALSEIVIEYSRPSVKNRTVFGDVVPYGKIWRTGANAATKISFGEDVKIEGQAVPSGTYALYSIPNKDSWELLLYKDLALGGNVADYKKENEALRFTVKPTQTNDKTETMTFSIADMTSNSANIQLTWDKTRISFNVTADIDAKIMKSIETSVINDNRPYYQAASYYYDTNRDLIKASEWINRAIAVNPKAYWMYMLKAKIQAKQNDRKGAVATAETVAALAKEAKNDDYVKQAESFIAENKK
jgi:hypothetical protein